MRISTIIPTYNRADVIGDTLRSVFSQSRPPAEVIVVDDGSTDGTCDMISEQFGKNIKLVQQRNLGAGAARNAGLVRSTGEIIHFQDSDDLSSLNTYEVQGAVIEAGADMAYGPWVRTRFSGTRIETDRFVLQQGPIPNPSRISIYTAMLAWISVFQPCLFRRSILDAAGPYRTDLATNEDIELACRIFNITKKLVHTPETILLYRVHPENQLSVQNSVQRLRDRAKFWSLQQINQQNRVDLTLWERTLFQLRKLDAVRDIRPHCPEVADDLERGSHSIHKLARPLHRFGQRVNTRLHRIRTGESYGPAYAAAPLRGSQILEIERLGYQISTYPISASA